MIKIDYSAYRPKIKKEQQKEFIFDEVRKQWVMLTPEEWVRQNFLHYLVAEKNYPAKLIAVEKEYKLGELKKRIDILVYNSDTEPWIIIECKEMNVALDEKVLQQAIRYNMAIPVSFLIVTNGSYCVGFEKRGGAFETITDLPAFI